MGTLHLLLVSALFLLVEIALNILLGRITVRYRLLLLLKRELQIVDFLVGFLVDLVELLRVIDFFELFR